MNTTKPKARNPFSCEVCGAKIIGREIRQGTLLLERAGSRFWQGLSTTGRLCAITEMVKVGDEEFTGCVFCVDCGQRRIAAKPWRNAREWRRLGHRPMFRNGWVFLINKAAKGCAFKRPIDEGRWQDYPDLSTWELVTEVEEQGMIALRLLSCYCPSVMETGCDFCNGVRAAPVPGEGSRRAGR